MQRLSPQQIQFVQLLQLNSQDFEKRLDEELTENPALELESHEADNDNFSHDETEAPSASEDSNDEMSSADAEEDSSYEDYDLDISDYGDDDNEGNDYSAYDMPADPNEENREIPIVQLASLSDSLEEQLAPLIMTDEERMLATHLIGMLEEDGYLRRPLSSISNDLIFLKEMEVEEETLERVLKMIQSLDPPGIAARNLEECLLLQLQRRDQSNENVRLATQVIQRFMEDLARKHYERIMSALKIDRDKLKEVVELIRHLNPRPGESQTHVKTHYIIPDFMVTADAHDVLRVTLNSRNAPELKISKEFREMLQTYKEASKRNRAMSNKVQFIKQKIDNAKWFIDAISQRQNTLLNTMEAIVELQRDFFITGDIQKLNPMILKDVADKIGMDISTVSRVANAKYVQTDFGIYSLKEFFSEGIQTESGEEVSNKEVKDILKNYIDGEDKKQPLTDEKLTEYLNEKGYNIARRTVAKYREQLNIPVARMRKEI